MLLDGSSYGPDHWPELSIKRSANLAFSPARGLAARDTWDRGA